MGICKVKSTKEESGPSLEWIIQNFINKTLSTKEAAAIYSYPDLVHLKSNKTYTKRWGDKDHITGENSPFPQSIVSTLKAGSFAHEREVEVKGINGDLTYWDINIRPISGGGNNKYVIFSLYPVTKQVKERNRLRKQRKQMQIILDTMSDSVNIVDKAGNFTFVNKTAKDKLALYGPKSQSLNDKNQYELFKCYDAKGKRLLFEETPTQRVIKGETLTNYIIFGTSHLPSTYHMCNGFPIYDQLGNLDGGVLIFKDLEDGFRSEEYYALKENIEDIYLNYASLNHDDFKIRYINEAGFKAVRRNKPEIKCLLEVIGRDFFDFYNPSNMEKDDLIKGVKKSISKKKLYIHKKSIKEKGETKHIKTVFQPILNKNNHIDKITVLNVDITDEVVANKTMEETLRIQEEIFINTSHEFKTPLNLIFSASQLLKIILEADPIEDNKENIKHNNEIIIQNCYRITKLFNNILDVPKLESGFDKINLTNNNMVDTIDNIVAAVSRYIEGKAIEIIFHTQLEDMVMAYDPYKLERALVNLISNGIKFSKEEGLILINLVKKGGHVEISVKDNGIGIEEENLSVIFQKYKQVSWSLNRISEGIGVGLSLAKSIVELHHGTLKVESTLGVGSVFTIELPIKVLDCPNKAVKGYYENKDELIKLELSDIY